MKREHAYIKLDFDSLNDADANGFEIERLLWRAGYTIKEIVSSASSPSGKGWHLVLDVEPRPRSPYEVVALQAILGSDRYREAMQMNRARNFSHVPTWMRDTWNVLYLSHPNRHRHIQLRRKKNAGKTSEKNGRSKAKRTNKTVPVLRGKKNEKAGNTGKSSKSVSGHTH